MKKKNLAIHQSELFWTNHPKTFVSIWMKYYWFKLSRKEFLAKYISDYISSDAKEKNDLILEVLVPIWADIPTHEKYSIIWMLTEKETIQKSFDIVAEIYNMFNCDFAKKTRDTIYSGITKRNYDTNYFAAFGLLM